MWLKIRVEELHRISHLAKISYMYMEQNVAQNSGILHGISHWPKISYMYMEQNVAQNSGGNSMEFLTGQKSRICNVNVN